MFIRQFEYLAADCCHVSQPALSSAIRRLEKELGVMIVVWAPQTPAIENFTEPKAIWLAIDQ